MKRILVTAIMALLLGNAQAALAEGEDVRYLLIFKAWPPHEKKERNLYELAREINGFIDHGFPPSGVLTDGGAARYGVSEVMKARVLKSTDSHQSQKSSKEGVYFLAYDPIYKLCARSYSIRMLSRSRGKIIYVDYKDGKRYEFPITTRRPFSIYEVEVSTEDIFRQVWEDKRKRK